MKYPVLIRILIIIAVSSVIIGCQCTEHTDPEHFKPSDYSDFVYLAYQDYWKVLDYDEKVGIEPASWESFADMKLQFDKNDIDIEKEYIDRILKKDKVWTDYETDRKKYEEDNPGKTYLDQIAYFISEMFKAFKAFKSQTQTKTACLFQYNLVA